MSDPGAVTKSEPPNHPAKGFFTGVGLLLGVVATFAGIDGAGWAAIAVGVIVVGLCVASLNAIRHDRNPWWNRSWADRHPQRPDRAVVTEKLHERRQKHR